MRKKMTHVILGLGLGQVPSVQDFIDTMNVVTLKIKYNCG